MRNDDLDKPERRQFLKGVVAAGSATALVALASNANTEESGAVTEKETRNGSKGYRLTPHIKDYYETLRS